MTLVASNLPPIPTSMTAYSTFLSLKYKKAIAVVASKKVHCISSLRISSIWSLTILAYFARSLSDICFPETDILSLNSMMWGDVYRPVLNPDALRMDAIMEHVDPLPSLPATCMVLNESCGLPNLFNNSVIFFSPSLIPCTVRPYSHSMASSFCIAPPSDKFVNGHSPGFGHLPEEVHGTGTVLCGLLFLCRDLRLMDVLSYFP